MKKSVLFLIGVICFVSIFVITFFGSEINIDQFKVYITKVEITNYDKIVDGYGKWKNIKYDDLEGASLFIEYTVGPENATNKSALKFSLTNNTYIDENDNELPIATIDQKGEIFFYRKGTVRVYLVSTDGGERTDNMWVRCSWKEKCKKFLKMSFFVFYFFNFEVS